MLSPILAPGIRHVPRSTPPPNNAAGWIVFMTGENLGMNLMNALG